MGSLETSASTPAERVVDPVGLSWLTIGRWGTLAAGAGAVVAAGTALGMRVPSAVVAVVFIVWALSNVWLTWRVRQHGDPPAQLAGALVSLDVAVLTGLLYISGGTLNPATVFYLVQIVMAALVLGARWTWAITAMSVAGYASLYAVPSGELSAAVIMHREIGLHMRGMWLAFALTALMIALLVTSLAVAVERRDRALERLREKAARDARAAGLATLAAGAAHELSTPLATIAVSARELEAELRASGAASDLWDEARIIREQTDRCRQVLEAMAAHAGQPLGETPQATTLLALMAVVMDRLAPLDRSRIDISDLEPVRVVWPMEVMTRAIGNVVRNACQASGAESRVRVEAAEAADGHVRLTVSDRGQGMSSTTLLRAGEPFFSTKPTGEGTGLGVFVARSATEQLGGRFSMTSTPGTGTTVVFDLPANVVTG